MGAGRMQLGSPARRIALLGAAFGLLASSLAMGPARASDTETFADEFKKISYNGNDGSLNWSGKWLETPFPGGPKQGSFQVVNANRCAGNNCLRIGGIGEPIALMGILREANLAGATSATFSYSYRRNLVDTPGGGVLAMVSTNGFQWAELAQHDLNRSDPEHIEKSVDITDWIDTDTRIAFFGFGIVDGYVFIDNVEIEASYGLPPVLDTDLQDRTDTENDTVAFAAAASDPDGGAVTYSATGLPSGVSIDPGTGQIAGTIDYSAAGGSPYTTKVVATDESGETVSDTFTWTVLDLNRNPTLARPNAVAGNELEPLTVQLVATDADLEFGDSLTFSLTSAPAGASIDPTSGLISWTPSEEQGPGTFSLAAKVADEAGADDTVNVTVAVLEVNQRPSITSPGDQANGVGDVISLTVSATDPDVPANTLGYEAIGLPPGLSINASTGTISGKIAAAASASSPYQVTVRVTDNGSPSRSADTGFTWVVTTHNRAPVLDPIPPQKLGTTGAVAFVATASDPDGDDLTFQLAAGTDPVPNGAAITSGGQFTWIPTESQRGATYRFVVRVVDDGAPSLADHQEIVVEVPDVNRPPRLNHPGNRTTAEGVFVDLVLSASDPNLPADRLTFSATGLPPGLSITSGGLISGTVTYSAAGGSPYTVTARVRDAGSPALADQVTFTWSIADVNRPPVITDVSYSVLVGSSVQVSLVATDADGDDLGFEIEPPRHGTFEGAPPSLRYRPNVTSPAIEELDITVSDGKATTTATLTIDIRSTNRAPVAVVDSFTAELDTELTVPAPGVLGNDRDDDGDTLSASLASGPASGTIELNPDGSFRYTPADGFAGDDSFTYEVSDGIATALARVDIAVTAAPPVVDDGTPRNDVVAAILVGADTPPAVNDAATTNSPNTELISRTFVTIGRAGIQQIPSMGFPLLLLFATLLIALTAGRISTVPLFGGSREELGWVKVYDPTDGFGLIRRRSGPDVLVEASALRTTLGRLRPGQRVRFRVIEGGDRSIATRVWVD